MYSKVCRGCGFNKSLSDYYKHPQMADGHLNFCKECRKAGVRQDYRNNKDAHRAYDKKRNKSLSRRARKVERQREIRKANPDKYKARNAVNNALRDKRLVRGVCEICGTTKTEAHHDDYSKPLEVKWLCFKHHRELEHGQEVSCVGVAI